MNPPDNVTFFAFGTPKGQPRPRAFSRGGRAAVYDPGTAEGWKGQVALAWRDTGHQKMADAPAYQVTLRFRFPRPKSHFNSKEQLKPTAPVWFTGKPDADNCAKAVLDALTMLGVWKDDALVTELYVTKKYAEQSSGCQIQIDSINP
jgi:Holliday junction resolvase RusA-like endonuclease